MNCLHLSCIFALWNNLFQIGFGNGIGCELLAFILYLCSLKQHNQFKPTNLLRCELLAFILYLCSLKQPMKWCRPPSTSCELLAFILYLCSLKQPRRYRVRHPHQLWIACIYLVSLLFETTFEPATAIKFLVVNCLHLSCIFALWNNPTTPKWGLLHCCELLAFILYLCSLKQPSSFTTRSLACCELLAFILYLCSLKQPDKRAFKRMMRLWIACIYLVSLLFETTTRWLIGI